MAARKKRRMVPKLNRKMKKKLLLLFGIITCAFVGLVFRLMYIEYTSGDTYTKKVLSLQSYDSVKLPFQRGNIVDKNGTILATSVAVYNVILDCSVMTSKDEYVEPTINALTQCFSDLDRNKLEDYAQNSKDNKYIVLKEKLSYDDIQPFVEMQDAVDDSGNKVNPNIKGVWFETEYQRKYPLSTLASATVGFVSDGNVGTVGLEKYYDSTLNGVDGREYGYLNSDNAIEKTVIPAENGKNLYCSIDANVQTIVENKIKEFADTYKNNARIGDGAEEIAVVMMNPNTGEIIAMADYPTFDSNDPRNLSSFDQTGDMSDDGKMDLLNKLWQNYCVTATYEPGSVQKPFTVATGLETGTINDNMTFLCDGGEQFDRWVSCVNRNGHGIETVRKALMDSCNDALMQMSYKIGKKNFLE